jgi:hypothetical protein
VLVRLPTIHQLQLVGLLEFGHSIHFDLRRDKDGRETSDAGELISEVPILLFSFFRLASPTLIELLSTSPVLARIFVTGPLLPRELTTYINVPSKAIELGLVATGIEATSRTPLLARILSTLSLPLFTT